MIKPLEKLDILITIFNQEEIIERVLYGVLKNTTTPFNLILVFDGCSDRTKPRAQKYLKRIRSKYLREVIMHDTPNLFETRANNYGFKLSIADYLITIQDDMFIRDYAWEKRLTFPLRKFNDVFAVTGRLAQDIISIGNGKEEAKNTAAFETCTLDRHTFAIRDVGIRGPLAFRMDYLRELNYLNDKYEPCAVDDYEISFRAWCTKRWKIGCFGIDYLSKREWSKVSAPDSTMKTWQSWARNLDQLNTDFRDYLGSGVKHDENFTIPDSEIDYVKSVSASLRKVYWPLFYPLRFDKRRWKVLKNTSIRKSAEIIKWPFVYVLSLIFGKDFKKNAEELGFKKAILKKK